MPTILLTGGRAPVTLELARLLRRAGHRVVLAESLAWHLSRPSRAVAAHYRVPPPRQQPAAFIEALAQVVQRERVDLVLPTCEEIFSVARGRAALAAAGARVLAEPLDRLRELHHKGLFAEQARRLGLCVPATRLLETPQELSAVLAGGGEWVLKPAYSRFGTRARLPPARPGPRSGRALAATTVVPTASAPWVAQSFLRGRQVCTYSLAQQGRLAAHAAYPVEFSAGQGAAVAFRAIAQPAARAWVTRFVAATGFTGQIAFDFIEQADGQVAALECNPRATSGVHLLAGQPEFAQAFFEMPARVVEPAAGAQAMLAAGMLLYSLPAARSWAGLRRWAGTFANSREVVFNGRDPLPALLQGLSLLPFAACSVRRRISLIEASTYDIEWNGEA